MLLSINPPSDYTEGAENCLDSSKLYLELFAHQCSDKRCWKFLSLRSYSLQPLRIANGFYWIRVDWLFWFEWYPFQFYHYSRGKENDLVQGHWASLRAKISWSHGNYAWCVRVTKSMIDCSVQWLLSLLRILCPILNLWNEISCHRVRHERKG